MLGYNRMTGYNTARYNAEGTEISAADSLTMTDATVTKQFLLALSDLISLSESTAKQQNKIVSDTIKLDAWLRPKRKDSSQWGD